MRLLLVLALLIAIPLFAQQQESGSESEERESPETSEPQEAEEAEPEPPPGPSIREENGVVIIGSRAAPIVTDEPEEEEQAEQTPPEEGETAQQEGEPAPQEGAPETTAPEGEPGAETAEAPEPDAQPEPGAGLVEVPGAEPAAAEGTAPETPTTKRTNRRIRIYNTSGLPVDVSIAEQEVESGVESQATQTLSTVSRRDVPYLAERQQVISESPSGKTVERRTQRYDPNGNPTQQEVVREEVRTLADGTVVTTATTYVENINGRMDVVERSVTREKQDGDRTQRVLTTERPSINGGFQPYTREESVETQQGEDSATIQTVRKVADGGGRLIEAAREETVMTKSGNVSKTEKKVWERDNMSREMLFSGRTTGTLTTNPDGSSSETVQTYGYSLGDGSPRFLNATQPQHLQTVTRETSIGSSGETIETTRTQARDPANPSEMRPTEMQQKVRRPGADGATVETHVYEQTVSGRMQPTQVVVEQVQED